MNLFVLNEKLEIIDYIDSYISLEWNKKYNGAGDFVLSIGLTPERYKSLQKRNILARENDDRLMIIEAVTITTSAKDGDIIKATGRSIEALLARRIVWTQTTTKASETVEDFVRRLVTENAITPSDSKRIIPKLKLGARKGYTEKIEKQLTGDNLLTAITEICTAYEYGFKMTVNDNSEIIFDVYKGVDRSYNQNVNPYVVFSGDFDNLLNTEITYNETLYTNVALIGGEGEGTARKYQTIGSTTGLNRYELFVDAKDISSNEGEITTTEYNNLLIERGKEKLAENTATEEYIGEVDSNNTYIIKEDYDLGDIVQIENDIGMTATARITAVIESNNTSGYRIVPTFERWEQGQWQYLADITTV